MNADASALPGAGADSLPPTIRVAVEGDAAAAAELLSTLGYPAEPAQTRERILACTRPPDSVVFVAESAGELIGFVSFHQIPLFHAPGSLGRITSLVVSAKHRRCGVGRRLVATAEIHGWANGCLRIEVTSGDHRPEAHAFYERIGFQQDCRRFLKMRPAL